MLRLIRNFFGTLFVFGLLSASAANADTLNLGFVSDWEYGSQEKVGHKVPKKAKLYLKSAVNHFNKVFHPDYVIGGGDYISSYSVSKKKAKSQLKYILKVFKKTNAPRLYCIGNHDVRELSKKTVKSILSLSNPSQSIDKNGFRIIILDTNEPNSKGKFDTAGRVSSIDLAWLDEQLNTSLPVLIFTHHAPISTPLDGGGSRMNMYDASEVQAILENHDNVVAVFSGHTPINYSEERNGITYVIVNNLSSSKALGSFADISATIDETNEVTVNVNQLGKRPVSYIINKSLTAK